MFKWYTPFYYNKVQLSCQNFQNIFQCFFIYTLNGLMNFRLEFGHRSRRFPVYLMFDATLQKVVASSKIWRSVKATQLDHLFPSMYSVAFCPKILLIVWRYAEEHHLAEKSSLQDILVALETKPSLAFFYTYCQ